MSVLRPALLIQTVYFHDNERDEAFRLGVHLYDALTRPIASPLAFGAGIPVRAAVAASNVESGAADTVVVVPVLGNATYLSEAQRPRAIASLIQWERAMGVGRVLPVFFSTNWRDLLGKVPNPILSELRGGVERHQRTFAELLLRISRVLDPGGGRRAPGLFVSHAKGDLAHTDSAAQKISNYVKTDTTGSAFFDATDIEPGKDLAQQVEAAASTGVFVAVRGDTYGARSWCQRELLRAKLALIPTLTVEVLVGGEARSYPYAGNGPSLVWQGDPAPIVERAMIEWVRAQYFVRHGERLRREAKLPDETIVLSRPPELLDLAQGPLNSATPTYLLHPDPELSVPERTVLRQVRPGLRIATPSTLYRRQLGSSGMPNVSAPLSGQRVALGLSDAVARVDRGQLECHLQDATVTLARSLIGAGAAIAYGGDFRRSGYTRLLSELVRAYKETADDDRTYLHGYLAVTHTLQHVPDDFQASIHVMADQPDVVVPPPAAGAAVSPARRALGISDMRRLMADHCAARVVLGGQVLPRKAGAGAGYGGRYPGIVEEAWWVLRANKPLYVAGGFGGAAALVARLAQTSVTPDEVRDESFTTDEFADFRALADEFDTDVLRAKLGLPDNMAILVTQMREMLQQRLETDDASRAHNGLSVAENHLLFETDDPVAITSLVMRGLAWLAALRATGKLHIELVRGSITQAAALDAIAIATFDDVQLGGAGAALDQALSGRVSSALAAGQKLVALPGTGVDSGWLAVASLGKFPGRDPAELPLLVKRGAGEVAAHALRHGFERVGIITFGGAVQVNRTELIDCMVRGLSSAATTTTFVWFETDTTKFDELRKTLSARDDVALSVRVVDEVTLAPQAPTDRDVMLFVCFGDDSLRCTVLPPGGRAMAASTPWRAIAASDFAEFSKTPNARVPSKPELEALGDRLARTLLDDATTSVLAGCGDNRVVVVHDLASSRLPFEALRVNGRSLSLGKGLVRRPLIEGVRSQNVFRRPPKTGKLKLALVANPTGDLGGAEKEADAVRSFARSDGFELVYDLYRAKATKAEVLRALTDPEIDVFHYCGHAFFESPGSGGSGILCAGNEQLRLSDLKGNDFAARVAFFNACQSARVRGVDIPDSSQSLAEYFLRAGVDAYLGAFWLVSDLASADFARSVYEQLAAGASLDAAVLSARLALSGREDPEWANFLLFGDGDFALRKSVG